MLLPEEQASDAFLQLLTNPYIMGVVMLIVCWRIWVWGCSRPISHKEAQRQYIARQGKRFDDSLQARAAAFRGRQQGGGRSSAWRGKQGSSDSPPGQNLNFSYDPAINSSRRIPSDRAPQFSAKRSLKSGFAPAGNPCTSGSSPRHLTETTRLVEEEKEKERRNLLSRQAEVLSEDEALLEEEKFAAREGVLEAWAAQGPSS